MSPALVLADRWLTELEDKLAAARMLAEGQKAEILSLQNQLREAQQHLAALRPFDDRRLHIHIDESQRTYVVERLFAVRLTQPFAEFRKAVEARTRIAAELAADGEPPTHISAVIAARAD